MQCFLHFPYVLSFNIAETIDAKGNVTTYTYDDLSRPTCITYPNNTTETVVYNDTANTITVTDRAGKITLLKYDGIGQNTSAEITAGEDEYTHYTKEYDSSGRLTKYTIYESDSPIAQVVYEYYSDDTVKSQRVYDAVTDVLMSEQTYAYNEITETPERINTTTIRKSGTEELVVKQYSNIYGIPVKATAGNADGSLLRTETYTADLLGNILSVTDSNGNVMSYTYDYLNRMLTETDSAGELEYTYTGAYLTKATDKEGYSTNYTYDMRGLSASETNPTSHYIKSYYDSLGNLRLTEAGKGTTYDTTEYLYDDMNNLTHVITHPTTDTSEITKYTYDGVGNLTSMITGLTSLTEEVDPTIHSVTTYTYDIYGNCISETDPLGNTKTAVYNTLGYITSETDRMGQTATFTYDALMRPLQRSKGTESVGYTYDYYGNIVGMLDSTGQVSYNYDVLGNLLSETRGTTVLGYTYDAVGNRITFDVSATDYMRKYEYNLNSVYRLSSMYTGEDDARGYRFKYTYNDNGNLTKFEAETYYGGSAQIETNRTYDAASRPLTVKNTPKGASGASKTGTATYNYSGNISTAVTIGGTVNYTYDGAGRLLTETDDDDNITTYTYDARGNRISKTTPTETITYTYDLANKLLSQTKVSGDVTETTNYTYDLNGNLISKQCGENFVTYTYNSVGLLMSVTDSATLTTATYTYDGNNLRQTKTVTVNGGEPVTTKFVYDGATLIAEVIDEDNQKSYIYGDGLEAMFTADQDYFINRSILNDVERLTRRSSTYLHQSNTYDAFGNKTIAAGTELCPVGYRGEYHDAESGLIYLRNRYYDPSVGRFITEDPVKDGSNWYAYCGNNPVMFVDPWGLDAILLTDENGASGFGHTSALYQDSAGEWYYTYWGDEAAAVIHIPKVNLVDGVVIEDFMESLSTFNTVLSHIINKYGFENITTSYTDATYVFGDFTASLDAAIQDVRSAYANILHSPGILKEYNYNTIVYQGQNSPYNLWYNNCLDRTVSNFKKGTLSDGSSVASYLKANGYNDEMIPKKARGMFATAFLNKTFSSSEALNLLKQYASIYSTGSHLTRNARKGNYAVAASR